MTDCVDTLARDPNKTKVLVIRMLATADVCAIALPALRFFKQTLPEAEIHFLTYGESAKLIQQVEPSIGVQTLETDEWPDDFFKAMESFLGLAEKVIGQEYAQIINLDTAFMPCFLSRFLLDAGEPVSGNYLSMSIQDLLAKVQDQSLEASYVNALPEYLSSSFTGMYRWTLPWWEAPNLPAGGYPEFYLTQCCGLGISALNTGIDLLADKRLNKLAQKQKVIGLCFEHAEDGVIYPYVEQLKAKLVQYGYHVWLGEEAGSEIKKRIKMMAASDLVVCKASGDRWYAQATDTPVLLITGASEPAVFMPDYATEQHSICPRHSEQPNRPELPCYCDQADNLAESIVSIFEQTE